MRYHTLTKGEGIRELRAKLQTQRAFAVQFMGAVVKQASEGNGEAVAFLEVCATLEEPTPWDVAGDALRRLSTSRFQNGTVARNSPVPLL